MPAEDKGQPAQLQVEPTQGLAAVVSNPLASKLYMQSFGTFASPIDLTVLIVNCGAPTGLVTMTYSAAKSLAKALNDMISAYEKNTGAPVPLVDEVQQTISLSMQPKQ